MFMPVSRLRRFALIALIGLAVAAGFAATSPAQAATIGNVGSISVAPRLRYVDLTVSNVTIQTAANRPSVTTTLAQGAAAPDLLLVKGETVTVCATVANIGTVSSPAVFGITTRGPAFMWWVSPADGIHVTLAAGQSSRLCSTFAMPDFAYQAKCPALEKPAPWDFDARVVAVTANNVLTTDRDAANNDSYSSDFAIYDGCLDGRLR